MKPYFSFFILLLAGSNLSAQNALPKKDTLKDISVFLDCKFCDMDYIKKEIPFVNYIRDQEGANVYLIITEQNTGSGGKEYTILFTGQKHFEFMNDIFRYTSKPSDTENEIRTGLTQMIKLGIMRYVAKTTAGEQIAINFSDEQKKTEPVKDKWRNWIYTIDMYGSASGEEAYSTQSVNTNLSANKVTEKIKFLNDGSFNYRENNFSFDDTVITSHTVSKNFRTIFVRSMGEHWSAGGITNLSSSSYRNINWQIDFFPAIEYDLFPYSEYSNKQLRFLYNAGYTFSEYIDTTIFNKKKEGLYSHNLEIALKIIKNWGSISAAVNGFSYFHDFSKNSLDIWTQLSIRIIKGLSVSISGNTSFIHDQISLPKVKASSEDVLLKQRQLATQYSYYGNVGISYTFGSLYNNIVNPRFGD